MGFYLNKVLSHLLPVTMRRVEADAQGFSDNRGNQNRPPSGTNTSSWTNTSSGDSGNPFDNDFFRQHAPTVAANWRPGENHYEKKKKKKNPLVDTPLKKKKKKKKKK